jgi:hypothetical protein
MKLLLLFVFIIINGDDCSLKKPDNLNINPCGYDCVLDSSGECKEICIFSNLYYVKNGVCVLLRNCKDRQALYVSKWPCGENCWVDLKDGLCKGSGVSETGESRSYFVYRNNSSDNENVIPNKHHFLLLSAKVSAWFLYVFISCGLFLTVLISVGGIFCCKKTKNKHKKSENCKDRSEREKGENVNKKAQRNSLVTKDGYVIFEIENKLQLSETQKSKLMFHSFTNILNVMIGYFLL